MLSHCRDRMNRHTRMFAHWSIHFDYCSYFRCRYCWYVGTVIAMGDWFKPMLLHTSWLPNNTFQSHVWKFSKLFSKHKNRNKRQPFTKHIQNNQLDYWVIVEFWLDVEILRINTPYNVYNIMLTSKRNQIPYHNVPL